MDTRNLKFFQEQWEPCMFLSRGVAGGVLLKPQKYWIASGTHPKSWSLRDTAASPLFPSP